MMTHKPDHEYPWWVEIANQLEWHRHYDIVDWGLAMWGFDNWCVTWKGALSGSPSRAHKLFSTYFFKNYDDAVIFSITWSGDVD